MRTSRLIDAFAWEGLDRVIVLSPHLDDAALSAGGLLHALAGRVERCVITIFAGDPEGGRPRKGLARPAGRRREDAQAWRGTGVTALRLGFRDAADRRCARTGRYLYEHPARRWIAPRGLEDPLVAEVALVLRRLCEGMGRVLVVAPMGIGEHVDHVVTARAAWTLAGAARVIFYEDFPYVALPGLGQGGTSPVDALARRGLAPVSRLALAVDPDAKARLLAPYVTQVRSLFGGASGLRRCLDGRAEGEVYWRARDPSSGAPRERASVRELSRGGHA